MRYVTLTTVKGKAKSAPPDNRKPQAWFSLLLESFMSTSTIMISSMYQKIDLCNEVQEIKEQIFRSIINQLLYNSIYNEVVEKFLKNRIRRRMRNESWSRVFVKSERSKRHFLQPLAHESKIIENFTIPIATRIVARQWESVFCLPIEQRDNSRKFLRTSRIEN